MYNKKIRKQINPRKRYKIFARDNYTCKSCGVTSSTAPLEVDHIDNDPSNNDEHNLQTLCADCNMKKYHSPRTDITIDSPNKTISPEEKLIKVKEFINLHQDATVTEIKFMILNNQEIGYFNYNTNIIECLVSEYTGKFKDKHLDQRDLLINAIYRKYIPSSRKLSTWLQEIGLKLSHTQVAEIVRELETN